MRTPLQTAAAIVAAVALLISLCGQGWGDEIVFRNQMRKGRTLHITCSTGRHGPKQQPVAYHANITFTMPSYVLDLVSPLCVASYAGHATDSSLQRFVAYSFLRDHCRCKQRCTIVAMPDGLYTTELVGYYNDMDVRVPN